MAYLMICDTMREDNLGIDPEIKFFRELVADIKSKRELSSLDDSFIEKKLLALLKAKEHNQDKDKAISKLNLAKSYKQFSKSVEHDFLIKMARSELRKLYGVFIMEDYKKKESMLSSIKFSSDKDPEEESQNMEVHRKLLSLHKSTNERLESYQEVYERVFDIIKGFQGDESMKQKFIFLDLACGLNPVSSIFFRDKIKKYYASDISEKDCGFLKEYFDKIHLDAEVFPMDLTEEKEYPRLAKVKADICFILKTLDQIERVKRGISESLLKSINAKYIVVSFPTISISGKNPISLSKREWFERLLEKLHWRFEKFEISTELFYVIDKKITQST